MSSIRSPRKGALRRVVAAAAGIALVATLAACASNGSSSGDNGGDTPAAELGDTLRFGAIGGMTDSVSPWPAKTSAMTQAMGNNIYEGLTRVGRDGSVEYVLAESMEPNDSLDVWTIHLREGVKKHDGAEFTSADVVWSLNWILDPANAYASSAEIKAVDAARITAVDEYTVEIGLKQPFGPLPVAFTSVRLRMAGEGASEENPIGTGPFQLESYTLGQRAELTRFEDYWGEQPGFDKLTMITFADQAALTNALRGSQIDVAHVVPFAEVPTLQAAQGIELLESESASKAFMSFRVDLAPFDDPRVREAMRLIADREQILQNAYNGFGTIANDFNGNNTSCPAPDVPQREQDLDRAKQLLAEAGQSNLEVEVVTDGGFGGMMEFAQLYSQQAAEIGVTVKVTKLDSGAFLAKWREWPALMSAASQLYITLAPRYFTAGGENNASHWADPEYQQIVDKLFATADPAEQCKYVTELQRIEWERGGDIVAVFPKTIIAFSSKVHGLQSDMYGRSSYLFEGVTIEK